MQNIQCQLCSCRIGKIKLPEYTFGSSFVGVHFEDLTRILRQLKLG